MALKFGSKSGTGYKRDAFPSHSGVQSGPLNSGSPAKFDWEATKDIIKKTDWLGTEPKKEDVRPPVGTKGTEKPTESKSSNKPYVKPGGKATGKIGDYAQGSQERAAEYDARGWAHDKTTTGHKDYKKPEITKETKTKTTPDPRPEIKGSFKDNYQEGSEKTKFLENKLRKKDQQTEDAYVEKELAEAHSGKYGKGLFGGFLRRQGAKAKHKRKGRQEDRVREKYNKSKAYDAMTPEQRASADATKKADRLKNRKLIEAEFKDAAHIIGGSGHKGGSGDALRAQVSKNEQLVQNEADQKIKSQQADLSASKNEYAQNLINRSRELDIQKKELDMNTQAKANAGGGELPSTESFVDETYADKITKQYSA